MDRVRPDREHRRHGEQSRPLIGRPCHRPQTERAGVRQGIGDVVIAPRDGVPVPRDHSIAVDLLGGTGHPPFITREQRAQSRVPIQHHITDKERELGDHRVPDGSDHHRPLAIAGRVQLGHHVEAVPRPVRSLCRGNAEDIVDIEPLLVESHQRTLRLGIREHATGLVSNPIG